MNMKIKGIRVLLAAAALCFCAASASADIKVKSRSTFVGQAGQSAPATESTIYIKGKRQRAENEGGTANITQCDLRRTVQLNGATKTYIVSSWEAEGGNTGSTQTASGAGRVEPSRKGGIITSTISATDTGERKQMFGYTARRIKTSMVTESSPDACQQTKTRIDSDGWYIDLAVEFDCYEKSMTAYNASAQTGGCRDQYRTKQTGAAKLGYPVLVTTTMYDDAGRPSFTFTQEVLEISKATLDAALFDVPAGYREVKNAAELYTGMASSGRDSDEDDETADTSYGQNGAGGMNNTGAKVNVPSTEGALAVGPKQPGMVRVGVAMTNATASEGIDASTLAEAVRNTLVNSLRGPSVEVVTLNARVPMQVENEARQKECDYVVYTTVALKKGSGGGGGGGGLGGFLRKAAPVADVVSVGGAAGSTGGAVAVGATTAGIYTASSVAGSVKARDEMMLDYILQRAGTAIVSNKLKAKARSDGEDLITGLVEQVASVVRNQAAGK